MCLTKGRQRWTSEMNVASNVLLQQIVFQCPLLAVRACTGTHTVCLRPRRLLVSQRVYNFTVVELSFLSWKEKKTPWARLTGYQVNRVVSITITLAYSPFLSSLSVLLMAVCNLSVLYLQSLPALLCDFVNDKHETEIQSFLTFDKC